MYQKKSVQVIGVGNSGHLGIVVRKFFKFPVSKPQSVRKRNYKDLNVLACTRRHLGIRVTVSVQPLNFTRVPVAEWLNAEVISI